MELKLEGLAYQRKAIDAVVRLFEGQPPNTFDTACREGVRSNVLTIPFDQVRENLLAVIEDGGIDEEAARLDQALDFCIEMETGTGKTLVYLKTVYELYRKYAFTKFIILVPSVAIKVMRNLVYRLTPFDSYRQGLVKKIEVLTVAEQNQEATLRVELVEVKTYQDGKPPRAKLRLWYARRDGSFASRESPFLKVGDDLEEKTGNVGYRGYVIRRISKPLRERTYRCEFENGAVVVEKEKAADLEGIFGKQLYWLIDSHFTKRDRLAPHGIKCLSLIFIDRVDNYVQPDGIIRRLFAEKYRQVCQERLNREPSDEEVTAVQGYYFARTGKGEYTDNERSMRTNKEYPVFKTRAKGVMHA